MLAFEYSRWTGNPTIFTGSITTLTSSIKGTVSSWDGFGFLWHVWSLCSRPKERTGPVFKIFRFSNDFITQKAYLSPLMRVYVGLIMLAACTLVGFLALNWSAAFGTFLQVPCRPLLPIGWRIVQIYVNDGGKRPIQSRKLLVQYKQQANSLLWMHNTFRLWLAGMTKISS